MRWSANEIRPYYDSWHRWFAWYPVRVGQEWVWMERVLRRLICGGLMRDDGYQYKRPIA